MPSDHQGLLQCPEFIEVGVQRVRELSRSGYQAGDCSNAVSRFWLNPHRSVQGMSSLFGHPAGYREYVFRKRQSIWGYLD